MTRFAPAAFLLAAFISLLASILAFVPPRGWEVRARETPLDIIAPKQAAQWKFLRQVWLQMPRHVVYTVRAPDLHDEMSIYMMSLAMFPDSIPRASSYFGFPRPEGALDAQILLCLPCMNPPPERSDCKPVGDGCICLRSST